MCKVAMLRRRLLLPNTCYICNKNMLTKSSSSSWRSWLLSRLNSSAYFKSTMVASIESFPLRHAMQK